MQWILLLLCLFAAKKVLGAVPVGLLAALFSVLAMLLMPVIMAGLMDGCRALEQGQPLKVGHLAQGFRRNAANLVTIGGIYLVGNLIVLMIILAHGRRGHDRHGEDAGQELDDHARRYGNKCRRRRQPSAEPCWSAPPCPCRS